MVERTSIDRAIARVDYAHLPRHSLRVCAVLVQNPINLGGLCRTAEAFRLAELILADLAIVHSPLFRNGAVSSQHWQPLSECAVEHLPGWIQTQKQAGYAVIALQANVTATPLAQFQFAPRSLLILGQELTGVPDSIVQLCDQTITIPQYGLVESLNVQIAGAIASYEYVQQHPLLPEGSQGMNQGIP